jgi:uncharacterized protein (DUF2267 family)
MTTLSFYRRVIDETGQADREAAKVGSAAEARKEQLSPGEADDVCAQLPRELKDVWEEA